MCASKDELNAESVAPVSRAMIDMVQATSQRMAERVALLEAENVRLEAENERLEKACIDFMRAIERLSPMRHIDGSIADTSHSKDTHNE